MKIQFLILAHDNPDQLVELAETITNAACDGRAIIHFDANSSAASFDKLKRNISHLPKITLVEKRIKCRWGDYSLVGAVLNALEQEIHTGRSYDYVLLLSGACLPCRPIKQLERYLAENPGREYIEAADKNWMIGGYREERYQIYFPFAASASPSKIEHLTVQCQKRLGVRRVPPDNLEIRFGSQWWALTWRTCQNIVKYLSKKPDVVRFFKKTYIPDEMMFQSLVWKLADRKLISGFSLTYFQFTGKGKPVVFYEDHVNYPFTLNHFFYRKISPEASGLRSQSLQQAFGIDNHEDLSIIGDQIFDYQIKVRAQTSSPHADAIFFVDRIAELDVLKYSYRRYVFICGPSEAVSKVLASVNHPELLVMGRIFAKDSSSVKEEQNTPRSWRGMSDKVLSLLPLHYLARIIQKIDHVAVFGWSPGDLMLPMERIATDPNALVITLPPMAERGHESLTALDDEIMKINNSRCIPGVTEAAQKRGIQLTIQELKLTERTPSFMGAGIDGKFAPNMITAPIARHRDEKRRANELFLASVENSTFRFESWFPSLLASLDSATKSMDSTVKVAAE